MNISDKFLSFTNTITDSYSLRSLTYQCAGAACGIVAAEMAIRTVGDLIFHHNKSDLSADLAGTLFYGLCAANIVPYTPIIGTSIFVIYSFSKWNAKDNYCCTKILNTTVETIYNIVKTVFKAFIDYLVIPVFKHIVIPICEHIIIPLFNHVVVPLAKTIAQIFADIFQVVSLPKNPTWIGVAILVIAIGVKIINPFSVLI